MPDRPVLLSTIYCRTYWCCQSFMTGRHICCWPSNWASRNKTTAFLLEHLVIYEFNASHRSDYCSDVSQSLWTYSALWGPDGVLGSVTQFSGFVPAGKDDSTGIWRLIFLRATRFIQRGIKTLLFSAVLVFYKNLFGALRILWFSIMQKTWTESQKIVIKMKFAV